MLWECNFSEFSAFGFQCSVREVSLLGSKILQSIFPYSRHSIVYKSKTLVESLVISTWLSPKDHELKAPSIGGLAHKVVYGYFFPTICTSNVAPEKNLRRRYIYVPLYNMYYDTIKTRAGCSQCCLGDELWQFRIMKILKCRILS